VDAPVDSFRNLGFLYALCLSGDFVFQNYPKLALQLVPTLFNGSRFSLQSTLHGYLRNERQSSTLLLGLDVQISAVLCHVWGDGKFLRQPTDCVPDPQDAELYGTPQTIPAPDHSHGESTLFARVRIRWSLGNDGNL